MSCCAVSPAFALYISRRCFAATKHRHMGGLQRMKGCEGPEFLVSSDNDVNRRREKIECRRRKGLCSLEPLTPLLRVHVLQRMISSGLQNVVEPSKPTESRQPSSTISCRYACFQFCTLQSSTASSSTSTLHTERLQPVASCESLDSPFRF
jgi:hypothetical protein